MKWITRERPKIDRIACPWLIKNFVDKNAEFIYVSKEKVFDEAKELDATLMIYPAQSIHIMVKNALLITSFKSISLMILPCINWLWSFGEQTQTVFN